MARHFLGLYLLIVLTLAAVSWGQDKLLQAYGVQDGAADRSPAVTLYALESELRALPEQDWKDSLAGIAAKSGGDIELLAKSDIAGRRTLEELESGKVAYMEASAGESWALKQLNRDYVLAFKYAEPEGRRGPLEWVITGLFYAVMALVIMIWLWPLRRDLKTLERATARYGDKNWAFDAPIKPRSQISNLAQAFRKMAARIDGLIASHKDMSNAVSHEIKTPLARMQFEIESAERAQNLAEVKASVSHIKADIAAIDDLVTATLNYAILERADMSLNLGEHNFASLVPAVAEFVRRDAHRDIQVAAEVHGDASRVVCDAHLMETVLKNLLYNAVRHARHEVRVIFDAGDEVNRLMVDDDGPGIPEKDRRRVFDSFVQLEGSGGRLESSRAGAKKIGFGLGLAIVKRIVEWHEGEVAISQSPLGGARVSASWPASLGLRAKNAGAAPRALR
jgi:two-component system, OmpR family, sensor kinase